MKIDNETVDHIAKLAMLDFDETSKAQMMNDLGRIITFVEKLSELDTNHVEPLVFMGNEVNVLRADTVKHEITHKDALKNAPQHDSDYFKAPRVRGEKIHD